MRVASSSSSARVVRDHRFRRLRRVDARRVASARATDGDDERASTSFSIVPADAEDGLRRYRAVLAPLFLAGGFLHVPDLFGAGPISGAFDASSLGELSPGARALTALWAVGGPAAEAGLATGSVVGDVGVTCVASAEIIVPGGGELFASSDDPLAHTEADVGKYFQFGPGVVAELFYHSGFCGPDKNQRKLKTTATMVRSCSGSPFDTSSECPRSGKFGAPPTVYRIPGASNAP